ncbi:MAG: hypothetical protein ABI743_02700, partial [bacterium]
GYGILHQGQTTRGELRFNRTAIGPGPLTLNLALVAKYNDPRQGANATEKRSTRLPAISPLPSATFAYRMPHGSLDQELVTVSPPSTIAGTDPTATTDISLTVRDWDARAAITVESDLSLDPLVDTVEPGEPGAATVDVSAPGITTALPVGTEQDPGTHTGLPGDEIPYLVTVTADASPDDGSYPALIRVSDPEVTSFNYRDYTFDLDPNLAPISDLALQVAPITYQAVTLLVSSGPNNPPTCDGVSPSTGFIEPGGTFTVNLSQIIDDSANLRVSFDYAGPASSTTSVVIIPYSQLGAEDAFDPFADGRLTQQLTPPTILGSYQLTVHLSDGVNMVDCGPFFITVGIPGECPTVTSTANSLGPFVYVGGGVDPDYATIAGAFDDIDTESGIGTTDLAGFRDDTGDFLFQGDIDQKFWRLTADAGTGTELTTASYPGSGFANRAHTYEVDSHGRVLWVASNVTQDPGNTGLDAAEIYANAGQVVHFFDTNGMLPVTADKGTISVGAKVVAMAIDQFDNLWLIDAANTVRKFSGPAGGTTYTEDTSVTFSLGSASGGGLTGNIVEDFDIDFFSQTFFVCVRQSASAVNVWRFECDGTYTSTVSGNPNPATNCFAGDPVDRADIVIDNYGPNMSVLAGPQDAQIIVTGDNGPGPETLAHDGGDIITLTARMVKSSVELGEDGCGRTTFLYGVDQMITTESLSTDDWCEEWVEIWNPPAGWQ